MRKQLSVALAGLVFGVGLALSGMTHASKVLGFLDLVGAWDPSLLFVLGGAVGVTAIAFRFVLRRPAPLFEQSFQVPTAQDIDRRLVAGAVIFGVGWGISGYCPGPGIALIAAPSWETLVFVPSLLIGALLYWVLSAPRSSEIEAARLV
jgi:uncharacterized membrane protein YedE/YeeE